MRDVVLAVESLKLTYGEVTAVADVSFTVYRGRTVALVGRNGAGKSTTLAGIAGLLPAAAGRVTLQGIDVTRFAAHRRVELGLGFVQEGKRIFRSLTVAENLRLGLPSGYRSGAAAAEILDELYERFPSLADRRRQSAASLSGGQQQMVAIATALASKPTVLLVDEPSSGLAPVIFDEILDTLAGLVRDGVSVILVEHQIEDVLNRIADDVIVIERGLIALEKRTDQVTAEQIASTIFG